MTTFPEMKINSQRVHPWLHKIRVSFVPGDSITSLAYEVVDNVMYQFTQLGHTVQYTPVDSTDIIITTAPFGEPLSYRKSLTSISRIKFKLTHSPSIFTLVHIRPEEFDRLIGQLEKGLAKDKPNPADFSFPGLVPEAYQSLFKEGKRGGPLMALGRVIQAQAKCIHILLLVGDDEPQRIYYFDQVGEYPQSEASDRRAFYQDVVLRMVTTVSTHEINDHEVVGETIFRSVWESLCTPSAMHDAALELGKRNFFTEMVRINGIVQIPALQDGVTSQYSEGCFATWDPTLEGLITTVTGSARPVDIGSITENDLAVIVGVRPDGQGAQVRHIEGKRNDPPAVEAVDMMEINTSFPYLKLGSEWEISTNVPVARSILYGHRGISSYNPDLVEFVPLDLPYYHFPVACATEAQARGIQQAFSRSEALNNPDDPRRVVFTVLPMQGVIMAEKWVYGKAPFQIFWEYFDAGHMEIDNRIPQGVFEYYGESRKIAKVH